MSAAGVASCAVDERAAAALRRDLAPDEDLAPSRLEHRFDGGGIFPGPHQVRRGAAAEQQADRFDQHGLAGAGLPRQDVERAFKLDSTASMTARFLMARYRIIEVIAPGSRRIGKAELQS